MKKVRFLVDLYDLKTKKFHAYNDVVECDEKQAKKWSEQGYVDILKEKTKKKTTKTTKKKAPKKEEKKEDKKE